MASPDRITSLPQPPLLQEPSPDLIERIRSSEFSPEAVNYAFDLGVLKASGVEPNPGLEVDANDLRYHLRSYAGGVVTEIVGDPNSASMGLVLLRELDLKNVTFHKTGKKDIRLDTDSDGKPLLLQMGSEGFRHALAIRAAQFMRMHSPEMHDRVRGLISGDIPVIPKSNTKSSVLEDALRYPNPDEQVEKLEKDYQKVISSRELAYARQFAGDLDMSRRFSSTQGILMLGSDGVVHSLFAMGGMPPVSGSVDAIVAASLSYMRSWIPRNGVFAGNFERQLQVFKEARAKIESYGLPDDITANAIKLIGIAVGSEHPEEIAEQVKRFEEEGGHAARIYTTSPDKKVVKTAKAIRDITEDGFFTAVGPIVDVEQSRVLDGEADLDQYMPGHGGGENCTSLSGGGAANSISIAYELSLDPRFNPREIVFEGGISDYMGALVGLGDGFSVNKRGIGGVESTQGIYVVRDQLPVIPYHGSASAPTKLIEYHMQKDSDPEKAARLVGPDGRVLFVEGKPGYAQMRDSARSNDARTSDLGETAGRVLADQRSRTIYDLRNNIAQAGDHNHLYASQSAVDVADHHRGRS